MATCSTCGTAGQDDAFCIECGARMDGADTAPTAAPEAETTVVPSTAPSASDDEAPALGQAPVPAPVPVPGPAAAPAYPAVRVSRRTALIGIGITAAIVLGFGLGFGIPALTSSSKGGTQAGTGADGAGSGVNGLQVSNAPDLSKGGGSFLNGYKETWRYSESSGSGNDTYTLLADAGDVLIVLHDFGDNPAHPGNGSGDTQTQLIGISKQTGERLWTGQDTTPYYVRCAPKPFGQWIVCFIGSESTPDGLVTINPGTGQTGPAITRVPSEVWRRLESFVVDDGALYVQSRGQDSEMIDTAKYKDPATIAWQSSDAVAAFDESSEGWGAGGRSDGPLVVLNGNSATAFDSETGTLVASHSDARRVALAPGPVLVQQGSGAESFKHEALSDGRTYCSVATASSPMLATSTMPPIAVTGTGAVFGVDAKSCSQTWQSDVSFTPYRSAWNGGDIAVVSGTNGEIAGVRMSDGSVVWQSTLPNYIDSFPASLDHVPQDGVRGIVQLEDGTILVDYLVELGIKVPTEVSSVIALDSETGRQVWEASSGLFGGDYSRGIVASPSLQAGFLIAQDADAIVRWDPADEWSLDSQAASLPSGIPSCPTGMSPLTFSRYSDGAILVCGSKDNRFAVVAQDSAGKAVDATSLSFAGRSCQVGLAGGQTVRMSLGGAWVQTVTGSTATQYQASEAWDYRAGPTTLATTTSVQDVKQCPAGSWPISLQAWDGGWLLVCGTSADKPTLLAYSDKDAGQGEATKVSAEQGGYCGETTDGQACAYAAPATLRLPGAGGVQRSAAASSFDRQGLGAQKGQVGAYGVTAPDDTAKDQVRYLVEILNSSAQTRANLGPVLKRVNNKDVGSAEIAALTTVSDSRRDLREAVLAAPVDQVPDGQALVSELAQALQISEDCDRLYVQWAQIVQAGQDDEAIVAQWRPKARASEEAKETFADHWNSTIVSKFNVQSFTADQL